MKDVRSRRCVFVAHCLLAQGVMTEGRVRHHPGAVRPILEFCLEHDLNIMQMPCPESRCPAGGINRAPHGKKWYEANGLRETAQRIAEGQVEYIGTLVDAGFEVVGVIGVELSPACAVNYLNRGAALYRDQGIYVEELQKCLAERGLSVPFVGVHQRWMKKLRKDLNKLLLREVILSPVSPEPKAAM